MGRMKRCAALMLSAALCMSVLAGCGEKEEKLMLSVSADETVSTFDPAYVNTGAENTIVGNLYENLMRITCDVNGDTTVTEGMAKNVEVKENYDGTQTYTFRLRNASWSDGEDVTAQDFVYAWQRLVNPKTYSPNASLLSVVQGYETVRAGGDPNELAVTAKNDSTLEVILSGKFDWFLTEVCTAPATSPLRQDVIKTLKDAAQTLSESDKEGTTSLKWWHDPTRLVTNGAYQAAEYQEGSSLSLMLNEHYYGETRNDGVKITFTESPEEAWSLYKEGKVDFVPRLPEEEMSKLLDEGQRTATPQLATYTVLFNADCAPFDDPALRKALTLAVDRQALAELAGSTGRPAGGLVPFGVPEDGEQDFRTVGGDLLAVQPEDYEENCYTAKDLLDQSSYAERDELEYLYVNERGASLIAQTLAAQWKKVLGVEIRPRAVTWQELTAALKKGEYSLAGVLVTARVNDAEAFLRPFTSDASDNVVSYTNSAYDTLLSIIDSASDEAARLACMHDAEALLLEDRAVCPLYTAGTAWKLREGHSGLCRDARGWFAFSGMGTVAK